ncbi:hypothetical protein ACRQ5Q_07340 [Bradyrhizobium sp. PMVTL-01]|uniref:hypothetical protein n=1 Tax=Bradyrhizobium sp. PMVTL-01 TaxID=3434999 RepID=UPI003F6F73E6
MKKLLDRKERSSRTMKVNRAQVDARPVKPSAETESLTLIVLFSTAGLVLSVTLAFYWPEVTAGYLAYCLDRGTPSRTEPRAFMRSANQ